VFDRGENKRNIVRREKLLAQKNDGSAILL
jgi:hypothetical protein